MMTSSTMHRHLQHLADLQTPLEWSIHLSPTRCVVKEEKKAGKNKYWVELAPTSFMAEAILKRSCNVSPYHMFLLTCCFPFLQNSPRKNSKPSSVSSGTTPPRPSPLKNNISSSVSASPQSPSTHIPQVVKASKFCQLMFSNMHSSVYASLSLCSSVFTPKSDQFQTSPAASPKI